MLTITESLSITAVDTDYSTDTFVNPLISSVNSSPDPWLTFHNGYYYFCRVWKTALYVWKSRSITRIDRGVKVRVWAAPRGVAHSKELWAPELHFLNGRWYIYYTASNGKNATHRMYVLESAGDDPQGQYTMKGQITDPTNKWAIDGTVLEKENGQLYFIWSGWAGDSNGQQNIYIAPMSNPWTICGERILLSSPQHSWESWINEGPQILKRGDKTFIIYSANTSWTGDYCLGMLVNDDGDYLNPHSWQKLDEPVFEKHTTDSGAVYCVGHCSFVKSPDQTEDWILYHGKDSTDEGWKGRSTRAQKFTWNENGVPVFGKALPSGTRLTLPSGEAPYRRAVSKVTRPAEKLVTSL